MGTITRSIANNIVTGGKLDGTDGLSGAIPASNIANDSLNNVTAFSSSLGDAIESVATDPVSPSEGQLWYNTTIGVLKVYDGTPAAWAAGGNLGTARRFLAGAGTQTAGLGFGGYSTANSNSTEYDGSTWAGGGNLGTARRINGTGTQTAGLGFGGVTGPPVSSNATEEYDGSSWAGGGNLNTARRYLAGAGIQTAGLAFGGSTPTTTQSEEYDGSSWSIGGNMNTPRANLGGCGTQTAALGFGGGPPITGVTELYDGTSWTTSPATLGTTRGYLAGAGTQTVGLAFGGALPGNSAATEEFTGAFLSVKKVTLT